MLQLSAPMSVRMSFAKNAPAMAKGIEAIDATKMACTAASAASFGLLSPMRRATKAVVPIDKPIATAYTSVRTDSVRPTVAMADAPSDETKRSEEHTFELQSPDH